MADISLVDLNMLWTYLISMSGLQTLDLEMTSQFDFRLPKLTNAYGLVQVD